MSYSRIPSDISIGNEVFKHEDVTKTNLLPIVVVFELFKSIELIDATIVNIKMLMLRFFSARVYSVVYNIVEDIILFTPMLKNNEFIYKEASIVRSFQNVIDIIGSYKAIHCTDYEGYVYGCDLEMRWIMRSRDNIVRVGDLKVYYDIFFLPISEEYEVFRDEFSMLRSSMTESVILNTETNRNLCQYYKHVQDDQLILIQDQEFHKEYIV